MRITISITQALGHFARVANFVTHRHLRRAVRQKRCQRWGNVFRWANRAYLKEPN